jgi:prepilin-type N-terminal cleavage/methylation domain-containing protein
MGLRRNRQAGFSLVELVIVIVIIGVIAAIAIPRVTQATKGAGESAVASDLAILRNAIEMYASEHQGVYPGKNDTAGVPPGNAASFVAQLTQYTTSAGATSATKDATHTLGPYLRKGIPPLPVGANKGADGVTLDLVNSPPAVVADDSTVGWVCNPGTGDIIANSNDSNEAGTKTFDQY